MKLTRRQFLWGMGALGATAVAGDAFAIEPNRLEVTRHTLTAVGDTGVADTPFTFVQISDLHLNEVNRHAERTAEAANALKPDVMFLTGDSVDKEGKLAELGAFMDLLEPSTPKFAILGNWEHWVGVDLAQLASLYAQRNCQLLINETAVYQHNGRSLLITGLDSAIGGVSDPVRALQRVEPSPNHLILAHCPIQREQLNTWYGFRNYNVACILSGHTHGGQITLLGLAPMVPKGSGRYVRGWYKDSTPPLYVSRGVGTSIIAARLACEPEVGHFEWLIQ